MPHVSLRAVSSVSRKVNNGKIRVTSNHQTHLVFGANTDVGKTLISAGLVRASLQQNTAVHYIKPLQCGGSDEAFVERYADSENHLGAHTLFQWETPASPHHASRVENLPKSDDEVKGALFATLREISERNGARESSSTWIETAGGVLSPSSSSPDNCAPQYAKGSSRENNAHWGWSTQADLYQPLGEMAPVVLVGDGRLGGISATLSSLESLLHRQYNVAGIVFLETGYDNRSALREYASRIVDPLSINEKNLFCDPEASIVSLPSPPPLPEPLGEWYKSSRVRETLEKFNQNLEEHWRRHVTELRETLSREDKDHFWSLAEREECPSTS